MTQIENIETTFSEAKIRKGIHEYLGIGGEKDFNLISEDEFSSLEKQIIYNVNDAITLIAIKVTKKYHELKYFPYQLEVGIGKFEIDLSTNIYKVDKCFANMFYDDEFNLITIDFFHQNL